ncbi:MAG: hypothetical protein IMF19_11160, partial [Proteobacteria bacterium]|nr:hypothetical protein [Pseudomonadota bacterium]
AAKVDMEEHNNLYRAALEAGARPLIVSKDGREPIVFKAVTGIALKTGDEEKVIKGF